MTIRSETLVINDLSRTRAKKRKYVFPSIEEQMLKDVYRKGWFFVIENSMQAYPGSGTELEQYIEGLGWKLEKD